MAPPNRFRRNIKGGYLEASIRKELGIITKTTTYHNRLSTLGFNRVSLKPLQKIGVRSEVCPWDSHRVIAGFNVENIKPTGGFSLTQVTSSQLTSTDSVHKDPSISTR